MITHTMTEEEIVVEITKDYFNAFRYSDHYDKKFRRQVLKTKKFPVRFCIEYESPRKNKWFIFFEALSKKDVLENSRITFVVIYDNSLGLHAIMPSFIHKNLHYLIYPPHFFSRFRLRTNQNTTGKDLIKRYFTENYSYVFNVDYDLKNDNTYHVEIHGSTKEGVALGLKTTLNNILFKTFITYEMLKGEQIEIFTRNEQLRKEIHG